VTIQNIEYLAQYISYHPVLQSGDDFITQAQLLKCGADYAERFDMAGMKDRYPGLNLKERKMAFIQEGFNHRVWREITDTHLPNGLHCPVSFAPGKGWIRSTPDSVVAEADWDDARNAGSEKRAQTVVGIGERWFSDAALGAAARRIEGTWHPERTRKGRADDFTGRQERLAQLR
jgi:hypothetical protein